MKVKRRFDSLAGPLWITAFGIAALAFRVAAEPPIPAEEVVRLSQASEIEPETNGSVRLPPNRCWYGSAGASLSQVSSTNLDLKSRTTSEVRGELPAAVRIDIGSDGTYPEIVLENSVFQAVIRAHEGARCGVEHAIRDWIIKSADEDQVSAYIDACAQRGPIASAVIVRDEPNAKTVRIDYTDCPEKGDNAALIDYTVFAGSPVIRVDYLRSPALWANTVDIGTPGGAISGEYRIHGQESYAQSVRPVTLHKASYWNTHDGGVYAQDPKDGGGLNYKGHLIMAVGNPENGRGFGRVMPVHRDDERGGARILKLLSSRGFETFPRAGHQRASAFTAYLFVFQDGLDQAVAAGRDIVDAAARGRYGPPLDQTR